MLGRAAVIALAGGVAPGPVVASHVPALAVATTLVDLDGRPVDPFGGEARATVLAFIEADCPISNRYAPELNRLHAEYTGRGVRLWLVYPGPEDPAVLRAHYREYGLSAPALRDPEYRLVDRAGITIAPEAAVFATDRRLVYRGRIDDRAVSLTVWRPVPRIHDLAVALDQVLAGTARTLVTTQPVGCYIKPLR